MDVWAAHQDDFGRWYGFVESRLRLLILALEQPPLLHSYPLADLLPNADAANGYGNRVSFFVALCFDVNVLNYSVSSAVRDFLLKVRGMKRERRGGEGREVGFMETQTATLCEGESACLLPPPTNPTTRHKHISPSVRLLVSYDCGKDASHTPS